MPFVPVPSTVAVHQRGTLHGQLIENVHAFEALGGGVVSVSDVATAAHDAWKAFIMPQLSSDYALRETYAVSLESDDGETSEASTVPQPVGGQPDPSVPGNVTMCLSLRTAFRGRSARGRQYISGLAVSAYDGNQWIQVAADNILSAFGDYKAQVETATNTRLVVVSRVQDGSPLVQGRTYAVTNVVLTDLFIDSQRRRLSGRGQ